MIVLEVNYVNFEKTETFDTAEKFMDWLIKNQKNILAFDGVNKKTGNTLEAVRNFNRVEPTLQFWVNGKARLLTVLQFHITNEYCAYDN